ncbi:MAG: TIR domain-containing protein [Pseudonocardiaceae bacterium]
MARIFVSHASADFTVAGEVHVWLVEAGHEVFLDRDLGDGIVVGAQWEERLYERLRWADAVVCVITSAYLVSTWCTAEVGIARAGGSRLLPLCAEPGVVHPLLTSVQHTDLTQDPVEARAALVEALRWVDLTWPEDRSPFPGLLPFDADRHQVFFGRAEEVRQLAGLLRSPAVRAVLLVVGPSGCGKSSLVRAGLVPLMVEEPDWWALLTIVPGVDPVGALARELAAAARQSGLDWSVTQVRNQLDHGYLTGLADELLLATPGGPRRRLLIVVDQFEELLTQTGPAERARFAALLRPAVSGSVQVVGTLRSEFLDQLLLDPGLVVLPTQPYTLWPLRREALRAVIEQPARLAGISLEDGLTDRLVEDTDSGEALPLLAFTLAQLADGVGRGGQLLAARYDQLGGVQGALTRQADTALADAITVAGRSREEVIAGLLQLVTVDEQGRPTRWRFMRAELPDPVDRELDSFVARRLLITDTDDGSAVIGVAHEAFLSAWPPLAEAITAAASALRARRAVEHAADEWDQHGHPRSRLWERGQLAAAVADLGVRFQTGRQSSAVVPEVPVTAGAPASHGPKLFHWLSWRFQVLVTERVDLSAKARAFLHASIRYDRDRRRRATTVLLTLLILAVVAAGVAVTQQRAAEHQQRVAIARQLAAEALSLIDSRPGTAMLLSVEAFRIAPTVETRSALLSMSAHGSYGGEFNAHAETISEVAFSPDGRTLATASRDQTVTLWDMMRRTRLATLTGHTTWLRTVAFSPDGRMLATGGDDRKLVLWDVAGRTQLATFAGHTGLIDDVAFSSDGRTLATASADRTVMLWDTDRRTRRATLTGHTGAVRNVAFSPDGRVLATASTDRTIGLWDSGTGMRLATLGGHATEVLAVAFSPHGHILASASGDHTVMLWDTQRHTQLATLTGHTGPIRALAFSPDGRILASAGDDRPVVLWDTEHWTRLAIFTGHTGAVYTLAFNPHDFTLASAGEDGTVILRNPTLLTFSGHTGSVNDVAFSPDGHTLATASTDQTVMLWDTKRRTRLATLTGNTGPVNAVTFSPDGRTLATATGTAQNPPLASDYTLTLWNPAERPFPIKLTGHTDRVTDVAFSPDGRTLATASRDRTVGLWDLASRTRLATLTGHTAPITAVTFSPDGRTLATTGRDQAVMLWDIPSSTRLATLTGHTGVIRGATFSPDGRILATASGDRTVMLWDVASRTRLATLTGHTDWVNAVAFSPDGRTLATASADQTTILWNTDTQQTTTNICNTLARNLTPQEWAQFAPEIPYRKTCII